MSIANSFGINFSNFTGKNETWYQVNGQRTWSKVEALQQANGDVGKIHFHWHESAWDSINWSTEPTESWEELMLARCLQLREKYNHLSLMYSGGYDSHAILMTFIKHKIRLDRIICVEKEYYDNSYDWAYSVPFAKWVKKEYQPWLEIFTPKYTQKEIAKIYNELGDEWIYYTNNHLMGKSQAIYLLERFHTEYISDYKKNKKNSAWIMGKEKPSLDFYQDNFYAQIWDSFAIWDYSLSDHAEPFYISYDMPKLYVKQCWMAVNFYENLQNFNHKFLHINQSSACGDQAYRDYNLALGRECLQHDVAMYKTSVNDWRGDFITRGESKKLVEHNSKFEKGIFKKFIRGIDVLNQDILPKFGGVSALPTIGGKKYLIKKYKKQKKENENATSII
jgi:hypothetical protein